MLTVKSSKGFLSVCSQFQGEPKDCVTWTAPAGSYSAVGAAILLWGALPLPCNSDQGTCGIIVGSVRTEYFFIRRHSWYTPGYWPLYTYTADERRKSLYSQVAGLQEDKLPAGQGWIRSLIFFTRTYPGQPIALVSQRSDLSPLLLRRHLVARNNFQLGFSRWLAHMDCACRGEGPVHSLCDRTLHKEICSWVPHKGFDC